MLPKERERALVLVKKYGNSSIDFFKYWKDKTFFFSKDGESFIAYRVAAGTAFALGDPVGPVKGKPAILREFSQFCGDNDWQVAFHQTLPDHIPIYIENGFRKLKIGEEAVVDLTTFDIGEDKYKKLRKNISKFEHKKYRFEKIDTPVPDRILADMRVVSDGWLKIPGRRERTFSVGQFEEAYLRETTVYVVYDENGLMVAFVNRIPSFVNGETTFDLMRHLPSALNGTMDYIFTKIILHSCDEGFRSLSLGMAPLAEYVENADPTPEERAVSFFLERMDFLFSYTGLQNYKAKFTDTWEPRYLIYRRALDLPKIGIALLRTSEINDRSVRIDTNEMPASGTKSRRFLRSTLVIACIILASLVAYFAWYELHPTPPPPAGKNQLVLRGQIQDMYFFPPSPDKVKNQKVLFLPGDGGWGGLTIDIAKRLADEGYEVYALDTKRYLQGFTTDAGALTEPQVIDDMRAVVAWTQPRWRERITLVGWSEGAGLVALSASAPNRSTIYQGVVVFGLPEQAELGWAARDDITYITGADPNEPMFNVTKYLHQVAPLPLVLIHASGDQFISPEVTGNQFSAVREPKKLFEVQADSHSFSGNESGFLDALAQSLEWIDTNSP